MEQPNSTAPTSSDQPNSVWRNEVHARVAGYRSRRGRRIEGAFSMRFPFPPPEIVTRSAEAAPDAKADALPPDERSEENDPRDLSSVGALGATDSGDSYIGESPENFPPSPELDPAPDHDEPGKAIGASRSRRKVIAFPKPVADPGHRWEDPPFPERPRILDVGDELPFSPATPLLDGLIFPSQNAAATVAQADHVELPLQAAAITQRLYAALIDCALVAVAASVFMAAGYKLLPKTPAGKPFLLACAATLALLWSAYQFIFLVYGGRTAGMQRARIRLSSFKGGSATRRQRRNRAIALWFATASLMMGLLWALVDVDALCWHDRISRTYLVTDGT